MEVAVDVVGNAPLVVLQQVPALVLGVYQQLPLGKSGNDGRWRSFCADQCPVVTASHYLLGVECEFCIGGDGEGELEGIVGMGRVEKNGLSMD